LSEQQTDRQTEDRTEQQTYRKRQREQGYREKEGRIWQKNFERFRYWR